MSDLPPGLASAALSPTYALRIWLTNLLVQTEQARVQMRYRIEDIENEAVRLRETLDRAEKAVEDLKASIAKTDEALRREHEAAAEQIRARLEREREALAPAPAPRGRRAKPQEPG
jgi:uncharacterized protein YlxW (UPF0749 family)